MGAGQMQPVIEVLTQESPPFLVLMGKPDITGLWPTPVLLPIDESRPFEDNEGWKGMLAPFN